MWQAFIKTLKVLASSRKFQVAVLSAVVWGLGKIGLKLDVQDILPIVAPLWLYIFGVAIEDAGKAAAVAKSDAVKATAILPANPLGE